jgi:hypothetical protein
VDRHASVFLLFLRHSGGKLLALSLGLIGAQGALFALALRLRGTTVSFERSLAGCGLPVVAAGALICFAFLLVSAGVGKGTQRAAYTLDRLQISPRAVLLWQVLWNVLALALFWAVQVVAVALLWKLFLLQGGQSLPQTLFLAAWRNNWLHAFLPAGDGWRWAETIALLLGLGIVSACDGANLRGGIQAGEEAKRMVVPWLTILLLLVFLFTMASSTQYVCLLVTLLGAGIAGADLLSSLAPRKGGEHP